MGLGLPLLCQQSSAPIHPGGTAQGEVIRLVHRYQLAVVLPRAVFGLLVSGLEKASQGAEPARGKILPGCPSSFSSEPGEGFCCQEQP